MKIEIEIPDWAEERHLFIVAGTELVAYKEAQESGWHVKTDRCNQCGKCCMNLPPGQYPLDENKDCAHLIADGDLIVCKLGAMRPFPCIEGDPEKGKWNDNGFCSIRYKDA